LGKICKELSKESNKQKCFKFPRMLGQTALKLKKTQHNSSNFLKNIGQSLQGA
jgi:hypothetical protein